MGHMALGVMRALGLPGTVLAVQGISGKGTGANTSSGERWRDMGELGMRLSTTSVFVLLGHQQQRHGAQHKLW